MKPIFITYPKCSTCQKASAYLKSLNVEVETRDLMLNNPNKEELAHWISQSDYPIKRFFNTSGNMYREMNLKDKLPLMSDDEALEILASSGWLVKRPILISDKGIFVGFHQEMYDTLVS